MHSLFMVADETSHLNILSWIRYWYCICISCMARLFDGSVREPIFFDALKSHKSIDGSFGRSHPHLPSKRFAHISVAPARLPKVISIVAIKTVSFICPARSFGIQAVHFGKWGMCGSMYPGPPDVIFALPTWSDPLFHWMRWHVAELHGYRDSMPFVGHAASST